MIWPASYDQIIPLVDWDSEVYEGGLSFVKFLDFILIKIVPVDSVTLTLETS